MQGRIGNDDARSRGLRHNSDPDDLARNWIVQDRDDIDADMVEWLARPNGILATFGEPWLENHWESLYSGIEWEYSPATRFRDKVYEVTATARIEILLPDGIGTVHASIPWNIRVKTRRIHVLGHPQWDAATIEVKGITLSQAELPSAIYQAKHYPSYEWSD